MAGITSGRAGSMMPKRPRNTRLCSTASGVGFFGRGVGHPVGHGQHAQGFARHGLVGGQDARADVLGKRRGLVVDALVVRAELHDHIRRALARSHVQLSRCRRTPRGRDWRQAAGARPRPRRLTYICVPSRRGPRKLADMRSPVPACALRPWPRPPPERPRWGRPPRGRSAVSSECTGHLQVGIGAEHPRPESA